MRELQMLSWGYIDKQHDTMPTYYKCFRPSTNKTVLTIAFSHSLILPLNILFKNGNLAERLWTIAIFGYVTGTGGYRFEPRYVIFSVQLGNEVNDMA